MILTVVQTHNYLVLLQTTCYITAVYTFVVEVFNSSSVF